MRVRAVNLKYQVIALLLASHTSGPTTNTTKTHRDSNPKIKKTTAELQLVRTQGQQLTRLVLYR